MSTSSEMRSLIVELREVGKEIARLAATLAKHRKRKADLEKQVASFLEQRDTPGVKYQGITVVAEDTVRRCRKKKAEKMQDCINVLRQYNISNSERVLHDLEEAMKGSAVDTKKIKISTIT